MGQKRLPWARIWAIAKEQQSLITRKQPLEEGSQFERDRAPWMAAVLICGRDAVLSHQSAGALWRISTERKNIIEVSVPLIDVDALRGAIDERGRVAGVARLRELLGRRTFRLTDSKLERRFLRLVRRAGLPSPSPSNR